MKRAALLFAMVVIPMLAQAGDIGITVERKKGGMGGFAGGGEHEQKASQKWVGEMKIENHGFKPSPELQAKYIIFVKRQELGEKQGIDHVEKMKGTAPVSALKPGDSITILTSEVELHMQKLEAGWHYRNGGQAKAEDSVLGIWVKLFDGTKEVAEYVNPPTLTPKYKWEQ